MDNTPLWIWILAGISTLFKAALVLALYIGIPVGFILLIYVLIKKLIKYHAEVNGKQDEENRKFREGTTVGYKKDEP